MALPARPYDPLYDTTYTVSGARDHYRQQTVAGGFMVERAPDFPNMFSELPHHPASTFRLKNSDKVPGFVDRTFQPQIQTEVDLTMRSQSNMVNGTQRFQYFRRPLLAASEPSMVVKQAVVPPQPPPPPAAPEPKSKTIGTQSDYRESEAQTMPWEPSITLPQEVSDKQRYLSSKHNCEGPELLQLKDFKFADGLPPGLQEVIRVEKMREKRAFEATLPPMNDLANLPLRQKMIEQWEAKEWDEREQEILSVQDERLMLIDQALQAREEEFDQATMERVEQRKVDMLQGKTHELASIQASRIKTMRQLIESRKYVERHRKLVKPTIVERYANYGSSTYAPVQREGRFPESKPQNKAIETEGFQPVTLNGIAELEAFMSPKLLDMHITSPRNKALVKGDYKQRQEVSIQHDLKTINDLLSTARNTKGLGVGECWPAPLKETEAKLVSSASLANLDSKGSLSARRRSVVRVADKPVIPELPPPVSMTPAGDQHAAAVLIQRLLRGRAAQNTLFEGKAHRMHLIKELQLEGSKEAAAGRPEDVPVASIQIDAMLGSLISQLAAAFSSKDAAQREQLLSQAVANVVNGCPPPSDTAALLEAVRPLSRQSTPTQVGSMEQPPVALAPPIRPSSPCELAPAAPVVATVEEVAARAASPARSEQQDDGIAAQPEAAQELTEAGDEHHSRPASAKSNSAVDAVQPEADAALSDEQQPGDDPVQQEVAQDQQSEPEPLATLHSTPQDAASDPGAQEPIEPTATDAGPQQGDSLAGDAAELSTAPQKEEEAATTVSDAPTPAEEDGDASPSTPPAEAAAAPAEEAAAEPVESAAEAGEATAAEPAADVTTVEAAASEAEPQQQEQSDDATPEASPAGVEGDEGQQAPAEEGSAAVEEAPVSDQAQPEGEAAGQEPAETATEEARTDEAATTEEEAAPPAEDATAPAEELPTPTEEAAAPPEETADAAPSTEEAAAPTDEEAAVPAGEEAAVPAGEEAAPASVQEPPVEQPQPSTEEAAADPQAPEPAAEQDASAEPASDSQPAAEPGAEAQPAEAAEAGAQEDQTESPTEAAEQPAAEPVEPAGEAEQPPETAAEHDGGALLSEATLGDVGSPESGDEPALTAEATLGAVGHEGDAAEEDAANAQQAAEEAIDAQGPTVDPVAQEGEAVEEVAVPDLGAAAAAAQEAQAAGQAAEATGDGEAESAE